MTTTIDDLNIPDPNLVGTAEYRAIYNTIDDALLNLEPLAGVSVDAEPRLVALGILTEFQRHAAALRVGLGFCAECTSDLGYRERCENNQCRLYGEGQGE